MFLKRIVILLAFLVCANSYSQAQGLRAPILDFKLQYDYGSVNGDDFWMLYHAVTPSLQLRLTDKINVGVFYGIPIAGKHFSYPLGDEVKIQSDVSRYGINFQVHSSRTKQISFYGDLQYFFFKMENESSSIVDQQIVSGASDNTSGIGVAVGVLYRITKGVHWNILEFGGGFLSGQFNFLENKQIIQVRSGIKFQLVTRK